jgi:heme exporter protein B
VRRVVGALVRKDLRLELRTRESVPAMLMFSVSTFVLFHFGLDRDRLAGDLAAGVLWVTLLFAAVLGMNRLFVAEREQGGFDGFLLAPVDRTALFLAKAAVLLAFLVVVEAAAVPAFGVLLLGPSGVDALPELLAVLLLADIGIAVVGTPRRPGRPDPRARPDRAADRAAAAAAGGHRGRAGDRALVRGGGRRGAAGALADRPRPL